MKLGSMAIPGILLLMTAPNVSAIDLVPDLTPPSPLGDIVDVPHELLLSESASYCYSADGCSHGHWDLEGEKEWPIVKLAWLYESAPASGSTWTYEFETGWFDSNWIVYEYDCEAAANGAVLCVVHSYDDTYYTCCWALRANTEGPRVGIDVQHDGEETADSPEP